ncbi:MAG TPA: TonB-dependent receptor [Candidatus Baltobacteraceae bacterium]|nr:TonB-dependent receptor [Candidatus Baltobacteraceae bacterium]
MLNFRPALAQQTGTEVTGVVLDAGSGLPVSGAAVDLQRASTNAGKTQTAADGSYRFANVPEGIYTVVIVAKGYQATRSGDLVLTRSQRAVVYQVALARASGAESQLKTIGSVTVGGRGSLQTTTTINRGVDPALLQSENYMRVGDALATVPGLNMGTSSAVGDDQSISIRGFNSNETATLLDGHPIGPIGAQGGSSAVGGGGFDYQDSPFWGMRNVQAVFGSGATGLYGASTIAGAIDFQTLEPTRTLHGMITQGFGDNGKLLTGTQATGTFGKLGFALAHGVEGTFGMFGPHLVAQTGDLGTDLTSGNVAANTYVMTGNYNLRNDLVKLVYNFDPTTQLSFTGYAGNTWDDKSGNGDTDFNTAQYILYTTQQNGPYAGCANGQIMVATNANPNQCMPYAQYAAAASGPAGGGPSPWQAIRNQDWHGRLIKSIGNNTITLDQYYDNYAIDYNRNISGGFDPSCNCYTGFFRTNFWKTNGFLASDDLLTGKHDLAFGFYTQRQRHLQDQYHQSNGFVWLPEYLLTQNAYFIRDQYQMNHRFSLWGDLWFKSSNATKKTSFDPRFTVMYRPTPADVLRFTAGHSYSVPDPALVQSPVTLNINPGAITLCPGNTYTVAGGGNPNLRVETATDLEASYGHSFGSGAQVQVDVYSTTEQNALFAGLVPFAQVGATIDPADLSAILAAMHNVCHIANPTINNLTSSTTYNAAQGRFRGVEVSGSMYVLPLVKFSGDYDAQSAAYLGVPSDILANNPYIINGAQIAGVPLHKADAALVFENPRGFAARFDEHFIDKNNSFNRPAFWFANASVSDNVGPLTLTLGANNVFNNAAQEWGYIGLGTYTPVNDVNGNEQTYPSALAEASEQFGLPYRQLWFTLTRRF